MKPCRTCGDHKPLDDFHRRTCNPDGHDHRCKVCRNKAHPRSGKGPKALWTDVSDDVIRAFYPSGGAKACKVILDKRSLASINTRAYLLGVKYQRAPAIEHVQRRPKPASPMPHQEHAEAYRAWHAVPVPVYGDAPLIFSMGSVASV